MTDIPKRGDEEGQKLSKNTELARAEEDKMEHESEQTDSKRQNESKDQSGDEHEERSGVIAAVADTATGLATGAAGIVGMGAGAVVGTVKYGVDTVSNVTHAVTDGVTYAVESVVETATNTAAAAAGKAKDLTLGAADLVGQGAGLAANTVNTVASGPAAIVEGVSHAAETVKDQAAFFVGLTKPQPERSENDEETQKKMEDEDNQQEKMETASENTDAGFLEDAMESTEIKEVEPVAVDPSIDGAHPVADLPKTFADAVKEGPEDDEHPALSHEMMGDEPRAKKDLLKKEEFPPLDGSTPVADLPMTFADAVKEGEPAHDDIHLIQGTGGPIATSHEEAKTALAETAFLLGSAATLVEVLKTGTGAFVDGLVEDLNNVDEESLYGPDREQYNYSAHRRSLY